MQLTSTKLITRAAAILSGMKLPSLTVPNVFDVSTKSVVYSEWIESFDNGENIDALRSDNDKYSAEIEGVTVQIGRVNCWLIEEEGFSQQLVPPKDSRGIFAPNEARGKTITTRTLRLFFFYQYGGGGAPFVRAVTDRAIELFNSLPKLGFPPETAGFIESHSGLQIPIITEGDFKGVIAYVRGCRLVIRTSEPL